MQTRTTTLRFPDGGTMDLALPAGFGAAGPISIIGTDFSRTRSVLLGIGLGAIAGGLIAWLACR
jgi:hypothetical protein